MWQTQSSWDRARSSEQTCRVLAVTARSTAQSYRASFHQLEVPAPYKAKKSSLEGAAGPHPFEVGPSRNIKHVSRDARRVLQHHQMRCVAALMRALSLRADFPSAHFLDRLATTATAGFICLPVLVDLLTRRARDTALTKSLEKDATKVSGGSLKASFSARSIKMIVGRNVSPRNMQTNSQCASKKHSIDSELHRASQLPCGAAREITRQHHQQWRHSSRGVP